MTCLQSFLFMIDIFQMLNNVHISLVDVNNDLVVNGSYIYYHYLCDGHNDVGWGCGYRTLQTISSWLTMNVKQSGNAAPSINEIQSALVEMGDKPASFNHSKQWIGSFEICICLDYFHDISCKIQHIKAGHYDEMYQILSQHFTSFRSPVMMGGDTDASSKCILGVRGTCDNYQLLILDPHCTHKYNCPRDLVGNNWISWTSKHHLDPNSFYNLCLPQVSKRS